MRVLNCLDPDQARHFVGPDLGPNCLQTTPVDKSKSRCGFRKVELLLNSLDSLEKMIGYLAKPHILSFCSKNSFNSFLASIKFCRLLITFANSLDPEHDQCV